MSKETALEESDEEDISIWPQKPKLSNKISDETQRLIDKKSQAIWESELEYEEKKNQFSFKTFKVVIKSQIGILLFTAILVILLILGGLLLWDDLSWKAWCSIVLVVVTLIVLVIDFIPAYFVMVVAMTFTLSLGILTVPVALSGFSNEGLVTIAVLFVVAKAIEVNKTLDLLTRYVLGNPKSIYSALIRVILPVSLASAFMNNTPIVAMMIPAIQSWSKRCNLNVSHLLMPLSFAALLGGTCTIIGTSTNLIVATLAKQQDPTLELGFFEIAYVGFPNLILCTIFMMFFSPRILKSNAKVETVLENPREYVTVARVDKGSAIVNKPVYGAGFQNLSNIVLISLEREGNVLASPPDPSTIIQSGDILIFSGILSSIRDLYSFGILVPATSQLEKIVGRLRNRCLVELVIAPQSPIVGLTVKKSKFRNRYNAAIIAIHRQGTVINQKIQDIDIKSGDTFLVETHTSFIKYHQHDQDFALINIIGKISLWKKKPTWKTVFVIILTIAMVAVSTSGVTQLVTAALVTSCIFVITRCVKFNEMLESIQGDLLLLIACAFSLGKALELTNAASEIAQSLLSILSPGGNITILFGVYLMTSLLTSVISNAATVTLMFPIAYEFTLQSSIPLKAMVYVLMMAGSSSFATPIGYQTNLMVQGPGGYEFMDFVKVGLPLTIISMLVTVGLTYVIWI